ncbi:MAG: hypothetical protein KFB96_06275 [Thiocapsa sp.]|uniref:DUF6941 family protein n=1 Tax=Thiocapsa sp. TaxID=2024551 RepID=UPI001BCE3001|nr:hypothetical protein [Thiocapsa sp.]QVL50069.1 MAG: hypothetical protein KFB96_06275 [Thiocapsa sp.]
MIGRQLEVIYCDDVRQEIGNKQSFIGVYPGDLIISGSLPVVLPKLCLVSTLILPRSDEVASARIRIMQGDQCLLESDGLLPPSEEVKSTNPEEVLEEQLLRIALVVVLSPFQVDEETVLRVVAEVDGAELVSRPLRIRRARSD